MWFERLFGFTEGSYAETQRAFEFDGARLVSRANGRSFAVGEFSTPRLAELREAGHGAARAGALQVTHEVIDDVLELHSRTENRGALFQVASQFNCLEFPGPKVVPEDGVTGYAFDATQGPACALAAAAGTVYRNYLAPVRGAVGQTAGNQIDNLEDLAAALGEPDEFWRVRNGYTSSTTAQLERLRTALAGRDRERLLGEVRVGLQLGVGVTFRDRFTPTDPEHEPLVSQAFCSAVSCSASAIGAQAWEPLATLALDAAYEATLWAGAVNAARTGGSPRVWLTFVGGGAFANDPAWITAAIGRGLRRLDGVALDVRIAHHRSRDGSLVAAIDAAVAGE